MVRTKVSDPDLVRRKQRQICQGAMKVFRVKGFHAASIREIARAARMSLGSLYDYVEKKEDILFLVHNEILDRIYARMDAIAENFDDPKEELIGLLKGLLDLTGELKEEMLFVYTETKSLEKWSLHEVLKKESEFVAKFRALIERGIEDGVFACDHPDLIANILVFAGGIIPLRGWNIMPQHTEADVFEALRDMALKALNVK